MSKIATYKGPKDEAAAEVGGIAVYVGTGADRKYVELPLGIPTEITPAAEKALNEAFGSEHDIEIKDAPKEKVAAPPADGPKAGGAR